MKARINNALLDYQWDAATKGGTMLSKWSNMDQETRLYASKFGLVKWRKEVCEGTVVFDGNDFTPLDVRDCGIDPSANNIRDAKWFQYREWAKLDDLDKISETTGEPVYPGLAELKASVQRGGDRRDNAYTNRILNLKSLNDRVGEDLVYPVVEIITEFRKDRWITFSPRHHVLLRDIPNPYKHTKIPVVQLKYYDLTGDPWGESEVEPVLPIWRAIQATVCGYLDNMNIHMRPPLKILDGQARIETIVFGPEAQWIVDRPDAVTEFQGSGEALRYFQTTYSALVSAFNSGMGEISQGTSNLDPFNPEKTATEVKASTRQQNTRDQKNQTALAEALEDMMSMWVSNNQQFLFADEGKQEHVMRIVGSEVYSYFKRAGMDEMVLPDESAIAISDLINEGNGNISDQEIGQMVEAGKVPKFPVFDNPYEKNPEKLAFKPKMRMNEMGDEAELSVVPEDLEGTYDFVADVRSMASGADVDQQNSMQQAIGLMLDPAVVQLLAQEGVRPNVKELIISNLANKGLVDAERYFSKIETPTTGNVPDPGNGVDPNMAGGELQATPPPGVEGAVAGEAPQPEGVPISGGI